MTEERSDKAIIDDERFEHYYAICQQLKEEFIDVWDAINRLKEKGDKERINTVYTHLASRINELENSVMDLSTQISMLKTAFSKINARVSTDMRKDTFKKDKTQELLKELLGGEIVGIIEAPEQQKDGGRTQ